RSARRGLADLVAAAERADARMRCCAQELALRRPPAGSAPGAEPRQRAGEEVLQGSAAAHRTPQQGSSPRGLPRGLRPTMNKAGEAGRSGSHRLSPGGSQGPPTAVPASIAEVGFAPTTSRL